MFVTWPKVQFRLQIRIFCVWSVLLYFPRCLFGSFLKKLSWYHCKPRINRVFQRRVIFCFFCHMGPPPLNFDYNQKIFRLTFQRANGLQFARVVNSPSRLGPLCARTLSCLDPGGQVMLHHPHRVVLLSIQIFGGWTFPLLFHILWGPPTHASRFPKYFFFVFDNCEITWKKCPSVRPTGKIPCFFFSKSSKVSRESWCASWTAKLSIQLCRRGAKGNLHANSRVASKSQGAMSGRFCGILKYGHVYILIYIVYRYIMNLFIDMIL